MLVKKNEFVGFIILQHYKQTKMAVKYRQKKNALKE